MHTRTHTDTQQILDAYTQMVEERTAGGWETYMVTLMFNPLAGNENAKRQQMRRITENLYALLLTRFVRRPHNTPIVEMPFWLASYDWPVRKLSGWTAADSMINDGMHMHILAMIPPNGREGRRLTDVIANAPTSFLIGKTAPLSRIHVMPIEKTLARAAAYTLKSVDRKRTTPEDVIILPRSKSELNSWRT